MTRDEEAARELVRRWRFDMSLLHRVCGEDKDELERRVATALTAARREGAEGMREDAATVAFAFTSDGRCFADLSAYEREKIHHREQVAREIEKLIRALDAEEDRR